MPGTAGPPSPEQQVLRIDVAAPYKDVDHAASGSLYGIAAEGWPPVEWIEQVAPKMFTQPPPGATHLPNQEPAPIGDTLDVWPIAARVGATVTVRLADIFPTFPYQWLGDDYWYGQVEAMVQAIVDSRAPNIYGYEIWNEPQWTWNDSWGSYAEMWDRTYRLIRELDPDTPIIGPSIDRDFANGMRDFLTAAVASDTVPDIISWHELEPWTAFDVEEHVALYREMEEEFGIGPLPISINEYGSPRDAGVPGSLARLVARLERAEVDTANLAFWHKPGRLSDLLVPTGGGSGPATDPRPTGNFWLFKWYGEMSGQMVQTTSPANVGRTIEVEGGTTITDASGNDDHATMITRIDGVEHLPVLDGFASADPGTGTARVIFGGADGDIRLLVHGLDDLPGFGRHANVQVFATERTGTDGVSDGPLALFEGDYPVREGSISVPVAGLAASDAYLAVITPRRDAPADVRPVRRYEAEDTSSKTHDRWLSFAAESPYASSGRYVEPKRPGGGQLTFEVDAAAAGAHRLAIRYANPTSEAALGALSVNGEAHEEVEYDPTSTVAPFQTVARHVVLDKGSNTITLGLDAGVVSVDYLEVTPFRERFEAESGEWSGASLTTIDLEEPDIFAPYFSNNAYVRDLSSADSYLRLPVTVPAAGTYRLTISYSTAGDEATRRAGTVAQHALRVEDGEWQLVTYTPTQSRDLTGLTTTSVELPAGTSVLTLAKGHPDHPGILPGTVDLDYLDVELEL